MFILRLIWIIVFLAASSLLPSFPMVECLPVPSATATDPSHVRLIRTNVLSVPAGAAVAGTMTTTTTVPLSRRRQGFSAHKQRALNTYSSQLWRRQDDEATTTGEDDLTTTIIRKYALHSVCSGRSIHMMGKRLNQVRADAPPKDLYAQLTVRSIRAGEISISNDLSRRFLCFNRHGKLIMRLEFREKSCVFHERRSQDHVILQSAQNKTWFVGFSRDGRALQGSDWSRKLPKNRGCYNFHKVGEKVFAQVGDINPDVESHEHHRKVHRLARKHFKASAPSLPRHGQSETLPASSSVVRADGQTRRMAL